MRYLHVNHVFGDFQGPRAQIDRNLYQAKIQNIVLNTPNLTVVGEGVEDLLLTHVTSGRDSSLQRVCRGVKLGTSASHEHTA